MRVRVRVRARACLYGTVYGRPVAVPGRRPRDNTIFSRRPRSYAHLPPPKPEDDPAAFVTTTTRRERVCVAPRKKGIVRRFFFFIVYVYVIFKREILNDGEQS